MYRGQLVLGVILYWGSSCNGGKTAGGQVVRGLTGAGVKLLRAKLRGSCCKGSSAGGQVSVNPLGEAVA